MIICSNDTTSTVEVTALIDQEGNRVGCMLVVTDMTSKIAVATPLSFSQMDEISGWFSTITSKTKVPANAR